MNEAENSNPDDPAVEGTQSFFRAPQPPIEPKEPVPGRPADEIHLSEGVQTVVGRYRLLEKIGEGGFGDVYVAEQKAPVRRRVALKIIKLGMDTRAVVARFEAERQALAMMDHPNIAKVFDAGATDTGRPYFVMELVRGIPITEYCDQNNLPPAQRLALFIDVCHAIQHAHQKGVIHRDIKPSNILVTHHDGVPIPKVIDFGIAKATQGELTEKTIYTQFQQFIGTPAYVSPEQAEMSALDVDTRSDIYSLGVLLYELLTGTTPFDAKELMQAGIDEMRRRIRETEPVRPSNRLSRMSGADSTGTAKRRGMEALKLITLLRGDLDWVVMKCLEKDRTRRYETANGLAVDIRRYLNNEPITARPPSSSYRFQKWARRNKLLFGAAAAVLLALLLGISVSTWQAVRATQAKQQALTAQAQAVDAQAGESVQRQKAEANQQKAEAEELIARQRAYASDMNVAQQALEGNNLGRALNLLNRQRPGPDEKDLRGWEWRYLWQQTHSDASFTLCQKSEIESLAISADGRWLAIGLVHKGGLFVYDLQTRQQVANLAPDDTEVRAAFSPAEPLLAFSHTNLSASGERQPTLNLWNAATQRTVAEIPIGTTEVGLAFSHDGRRLVTGENQGIILWSVPDGTKLASFPCKQWVYGDPFTSFAATSDLALAAYGSEGGRFRVIDLRDGKELWTAVASKEFITALAFSPDGKKLATAAGFSESDIRLWDVATGKQIGQLEGHGSWVSSLVFWPDGKKLASSSADQTIRTWDVASQKCLDVLRGHRQEVWRLTLLPDNRTLVSGCKDGTVCFWDTSVTHARQPRISLPDKVIAWGFAPDSRSLLTLNAQGQVARLSGLDFRQKEPLLKIGTNVNGGLFSQDGRFVTTGSTDGVLGVWDVSRRVLSRQLTSAPGQVWKGTFLADDKKFVTYSVNDHSLHEWDLTTGLEIQSWRAPPSFRGDMDVSPDQRSCLAIGYAGDVVLRNLADETQTKMRLSILESSDACFSADGRLFAVASRLGFARVWDTANWGEAATLGDFLNGVQSVGFSPDGRRLATGGGDKEAVKLWDTESWQDVFTLGGEGTCFYGVAFSPNGNAIGWASVGGLQIWLAPSWEEIAAAEAKQKADSEQP